MNKVIFSLLQKRAYETVYFKMVIFILCLSYYNKNTHVNWSEGGDMAAPFGITDVTN